MRRRVTRQESSLFDPVPTPVAVSSVTGRRRAPVRQRDPETSHVAAAQATTRAPTLRHRVLLALADAGVRGCTRSELAKALGHPQPTSVQQRALELCDAELALATPHRRLNSYGNPETIYVVTPLGRSALTGIITHQS